MAELGFGQIFKNPAAGIRRIETMMSMSTGGAAPVGELPAEPAGDDGAGNSAAEPAAGGWNARIAGLACSCCSATMSGFVFACDLAWPLVPAEPAGG